MLKEYTIWLENSECIIGQAEEENINILQHLHKIRSIGIITLTDSEGEITINMGKVIAISKSNLTKNGKAGF